jgi:TolB-like protein
MKKIIVWIMIKSFMLYIMIGNFTFIYAQQKQKTTTAVLTLQSKGGVTSNEASTLTDRLRTELVRLGTFTVLERGQMNEILDEQGFSASGCTSSECAIEAGRLLGVQMMIAGDVGKVGNILTIDVRLFDVGSGKITKAIQEDHEGDVSGLLKVMKRIARKAAGLKEEEEKSGGFPWLWVGLGVVALGGGAAAFLLGGSTDDGDTDVPDNSLPGPNWPPGN